MSNNTTFHIKTRSYNQRRYGKPWCAKVTFAANGKVNFVWGAWVGQPGDDGTLVVTAAEGEIIATGQKDNRGNGTECTYHVVRNGDLVKLSNKAEAFALATAPKPEAEAPTDPYGLKAMSAEQLADLFAAVQAEIADRPAQIRRDTVE